MNRTFVRAAVSLWVAAGCAFLFSNVTSEIEGGAAAQARSTEAARLIGPPPWAFGFDAPPVPGDVAPACRDHRPISCGRPGREAQVAAADDGTLHRLPGSPGAFTVTQIHNAYGPADWYPDEHPRMPDIVARGREADGVKACALCHYPNGKGKTENGSVAGLPAGYFLQQLDAFKSGMRRSGDPRKANTNEMIAIARALSAEEAKAAAEYYASIPWTRWVKVVETSRSPKFRLTLNGLAIPLEGEAAGTEALGHRIVEVPENPEQTERYRNPRSGFIAYVPVGSLAKGEALVTTGSAVLADGTKVPGRTQACGVCHGADLHGVGNVPGIAGRLATYTARQLYDMKAGTRHTQLMTAVVQHLTEDDILAISAYVASR